ncbi:hypothetical protein EDD21DRAFT_377525 [Dissophora ornata]|nr:hypothetical protein EDD21DRAFT_377525 [Dissophora ornata]
MSYPRLYTNALRAGYLVCVLLSILSATTFLSLTTGQSQDLCTSQICISATIYSKDPDTIEFSLYSKVPVGWIGLGMGGDSNGMANNDLAICWPNSTGTGAVISQRAATSNSVPSVYSPTVAFQIQPVKSGLLSSTMDFTCTYSRPLNLSTSPIATTASSVNVIFAMAFQLSSGSSDPQTATIPKHDITGTGALTIVRKQGASLDGYNSSAPQYPGQQVGSGTTVSGLGDLSSILDKEQIYDRLVQAHGIIMTATFLLILPLGAFLVRFFSHLYHVFRWHRPLQVTGFLAALVGFGCILGAVYSKPGGLSVTGGSAHRLLGFIIVGMLVLQVCIGVFIYHTFDPNRDPNKIHVPTWIHRLWGYVVLICGLIQVRLGLVRYGMWPTGKEAVWYVFDVWVVLLVLVFLGGSVLKKWLDVRNRSSKNGQDDASSTAHEE